LPAYRLLVEPGEDIRTKQRYAAAGILVALPALAVLGRRRAVDRATRAPLTSRARITFVAQVSHELRTPLTSIRMFAELLADPDVEDAKRERFAGRIGEESRRLSTLIERLLASIPSRRARGSRCGALDVAAVVREVCEEKQNAGRLRATLELDMPTHCPPRRASARRSSSADQPPR
jgi:signal transduction histidine kinase